MLRSLTLLLLVLCASAAVPAQDATPSAPATTAPALASDSAAAAAPAEDFKGLDQEVQALKKEVLDLNRELFVLEEDLLFPANTQVAVFVSMDVGEFFALDSVTLKVDNKEGANYLYTQRAGRRRCSRAACIACTSAISRRAITSCSRCSPVRARTFATTGAVPR